MKKPFFILAIFLITSLAHAQVFVRHDATGANDGNSWADAFTDLQTALNSANSGDQIWIADGKYLPLQIGATSDSSWFVIDKPLALYGGFAGGETDLAQRDWAANPVVLSGDINGDDVDGNFADFRSDNALHVVLIEDPALEGLVIDGLVISNGNARHTQGGGILSFAAGLEVRNCRFTQNSGAEGSALYAREGSTLLLANCLVDNNQSATGAVRLHAFFQVEMKNCTFRKNANTTLPSGSGAATISNLNAAIKDCLFEENSGRNGGAIFIIQNELNTLSSSTITIEKCEFRNNAASDGPGGAIEFNNAFHNSLLTIDSCLFESNNTPFDGGALSLATLFQQSAPAQLNVYIQSSVFLENTAQNGGAVNMIREGNGTIESIFDNCVFEKNTSPVSGGAIYSREINYACHSSDFFKNRSASQLMGSGGAIYTENCNIVLDYCTFIENISGALFSSSGNGGAISIFHNNSSAPSNKTRITRSHFFKNYGGTSATIYFKGPVARELLVESSLFNQNWAFSGATCLKMEGGAARVTNATFQDNYNGPFLEGPALVAEGSGSFRIQNTILNNPNNFAAHAAVTTISYGGNVVSDNSLESLVDISGGYGSFFSAAPLLDDSFLPAWNSPCVDAGNPANITVQTDMAGNPRIQGAGIDIGALESSFNVGTVHANSNAFTATVAPNPASDFLSVVFEKPLPFNCRAYVFDTEGRRRIGPIPTRKGTLAMELDLTLLSPGQYYLWIEGDGPTSSSTILKKLIVH